MAKTQKPLRGLVFEPLLEEHIPPILLIEKESNGAPWSERSFRNELDHPFGIFLVAMENGQVVGYAGEWLVVDEAHITTVAVAPEHRRKGIGRAITIELLQLAKERGMVCSTLEVRASNEAAIELYKQLGYVETARRRSYYPDNQEDARVMWLHDLQNWTPDAS
ncbi:MAG: [ribosomal protein S18]-alanine N-acetyltransferase [Fimbriimonadaceae bacterium]|jgi:ribosomal-protein-alanine N-acetyltransferase|nr:[ribosomal protein S18]-alanine N-acetyltransferase [Fimbriimonadaceae bacterium]